MNQLSLSGVAKKLAAFMRDLSIEHGVEFSESGIANQGILVFRSEDRDADNLHDVAVEISLNNLTVSATWSPLK